MTSPPRPSRPLFAGLVWLALTGPAVPPTQAADPLQAPQQELRRTEDALEDSRAEQKALERRVRTVRAELARLRGELVASGKATRDRERTQEEVEARLADLIAEEQAKRQDLASRRRQFEGVLFALQRLARYPPEAIISLPRDPDDTVRGAILLKAALPEVQGRASVLQKQLESLSATRLQLDRQRNLLASSREELTAERERLDKLLRRKAALYTELSSETEAVRRRVTALAKQSRSLHDLLARLETQRKRDLAAKQLQERKRAQEAAAEQQARREAAATPIAGRRGALPYPVRGAVVTRYGAKLRKGVTSKGLTFRTRPDARVIAPHGGKVVFAGPFRGYGRLLIIEHSGGYHTLLAGMARIDGAIGQTVLAGEPVGVMGASSGRRPELYLELRRNSQPINPLPWLAADRG